MKKFYVAAAALALGATGALAQTAQPGVNTGSATYSLRVVAADGTGFNCIPEVVQIDGVASRRCVRVGEGGLFDAGSGLGAGAGAAAVGLVVLAVAGGGSSGTTTTTN
ncbi:MAG: hypothetical protein AAF744_02620 [Pseudomonadota bacterium]